MDTGGGVAKWSDTEYSGASWEWRPWDRRPLGMAAPESGGPLTRVTLPLLIIMGYVSCI